MKKLIILLSIFLTSNCSILPELAGAVDPTVLDPVNGLLFEKRSGLSYIFFSKEQHVLIKNNNEAVNSYYKLLQGESYREDVITYKLDGWGSYDGQYIGVYLKKNARGTALGIVIQKSRSLARNAAKNLEKSTDIKDVDLGKVLQSPALYTLSATSPIVKTSVAGIFKPDNNNLFISINELTPEHQVNHAKLLKTTKKNDGSLDLETFNLTFAKNVSDISTIYQYTKGSEVVLIGIKFDLNNEFPRLEIIEKIINPINNPINLEIAKLENELNEIIAWEYGFFNTIRILDSSLTPFLNKKFTEFISHSTTRYNPLNTSHWFFNGTEDSVRITRNYNFFYIEEDYLLGPTSQNGIFKLIDFRHDEVQTYSEKFLNITEKSGISTVLIANTIDGFNNPIVKVSLKDYDTLTPQSINFSSLPEISNPTLGINNTGAKIAGRSSFQAFVDTATSTIHLVGGYTNSGATPSSIPQYLIGTRKLQDVYNSIYTIKNITSGTPIYQDTTLTLNHLPDRDFQQMVGATSKKSPKYTKEIFWVYGAGAVGNDKFSFNNNINNVWNTTFVQETRLRNRYHQSMVTHNNTLFIMGGTYSLDPIAAIGSPTIYGTYTNDIIIASTLNSISWRSLTSKAEWTSRVHSRVFSIGKTLVLVGGIVMNASGIPSPTNDVWISENNGTNWIQRHPGGTPSTSSTTLGGAPPVQNSNFEGPLAGTEYNGIIYLLDSTTRSLFYSSDKGINWFKSDKGFEINPSTPLYSAQLIGVNDQLILIGGQLVPRATIIGGPHNMESKIYRLKINI